MSRKVAFFTFCFLSFVLPAGFISQAAKTQKTSTQSGQNKNQNKTYVLSATSAVLIEPRTFRILYSFSPNDRRPPASTTKIMTGLLLLERGGLEELVTVSSRAAGRKEDESRIGLKAGEKVSLKELLFDILLKSANDASVAAAEHMAGSVEAFAGMMNLKAQELGCLNTHFSNPHGYYGSTHYSTAFDLAIMARYAMQNPYFASVVRLKEVAFPNPYHPANKKIVNRNKLLWMYPYADGIKTGATKAAGQCLVASATKNGHQLISVVLNCKKGKVWEDSRALLEYGFSKLAQEEKLMHLPFSPFLRNGDSIFSREILFGFGKIWI